MLDPLEILEKAIESKLDNPVTRLFYSRELGLLVDRYNDIAVVQWWNKTLEKRAKEIFDLLNRYFPHVIEKNDTKLRVLQGLKRRKRIVRGYKHRTIIQEGDFRFHVDCLHGQRTGFYLDRWELHQRIESYLDYSERTLDLFSYTGAFAIHASKFSSKVLAVDKSAYAVKEGYNNVRLNKLPQVEFVKKDALEYLYELRFANESFDLTIIDPPEVLDVKELVKIMKLASKISKNIILVLSSKFKPHYAMLKKLAPSVEIWTVQ
jgi:23S rRNA G2069 N7-methylase RlmK/C1962 C5-methylase RlmI